MKLNRLTLENITSLRGLHKIDFANSLRGESLFAITGPTGSGKSSLLNAISLALFGRTYKKSLNTTDYVSTGTQGASVELEFEHLGELYQARWSIKVAKSDGSPIKNPIPKRSLLKQGQILEKRADEIIGLNFEQFCRSAILNQGEFSRFLYSSFSERRDILEELVQHSRLSLIGPTLSHTIKEYIHQKEVVLSKLDGLGLDELEQLPQLREQIISLKESLALSETSEHFLQVANKTLQNLYSAIESKKQKTARALVYKKQLEDHSPQEVELKKEISRTKEIYSQREIRKNELFPILQKKNIILQKLSLQKNQIDYRIQEIKSLSDKLHETQREAELVSAKNKKMVETKQGISLIHQDFFLDENQYTSLKNAVEERKNLVNKMDLLIGRQAALSEGLAKMTARKLELQQELESLRSTHNSNLDEEAFRQQLDTLASSQKSLTQFHAKFLGHLPKYQQLSKTIDLAKHELEYLSQSQQSTREKVALAEEQSKALNMQRSYLRLILESETKHECALCHRPWDGKQHAHQLDDAEVNQLTDKILQTEKKSHELQKELADFSQLIKKKTEDIQNYEWQRKNIGQELLTSLSANTTEENQVLELIIEGPSDKDAILKKIESSQQVLKSKTATLNQSYELFLHNKRRSSILLGSLEQNQLHLDESLRDVQNLEIELEELSKKDQLMARDLAKKLTTYPKDAKAFFERFNQDSNLKNDLHKIQIQIQELVLQEKSVQKHQQTYAQNLKDKKHELAELEMAQAKTQEELNSDGLKVDLESELKNLTEQLDKDKLAINNLQTRIDKIARESERIQTSLNLTLEQEKECDLLILDYLSELSLQTSESSSPSLQDNANSLTQTFPLLEQIKGLKQTLLKIIETGPEKLENSSDELLGFISTEQIPQLLQQLKSLKNKNFEELGNLRSKETELTQKEAEIARNKNLYEKIESRLRRLGRLNDVLGKNDFRNWVLSHLEKQLIMLANKEISNLCEGRYRLVQKAGKFGPEFFIIDHWQSEAPERKISTLSGGETFLISLGLSLGLAELISQNNHADFFLIDEGFGSLDPAGLSEALEVLWNLQSRGKQIGIISHIAEFNQNIPVNFVLKKNAAGSSTVNVQYN